MIIVKCAPQARRWCNVKSRGLEYAKRYADSINAGLSVAQAAACFGVTRAAIYATCKRHGLALVPRREPTREENMQWCVRELLAHELISFDRARELMKTTTEHMRMLVKKWEVRP